MQHWNSYWSRTKSLNSFAEGEHSQGYVGEVADFWHKNFATLPESTNILDLATGNGGLAVLAKQFNPNFQVFASDAASIAPLSIFNPEDSSYNTLKTIHFYGNVPSENLTFDNAKFDRVISQFGFEYAESVLAFKEVNRVLKPKGEFIALVHHSDSFISADCQLGLKVLNDFNRADGVISQLHNFTEFCQTIVKKNHPTAEQQVQFKELNTNLLQSFKQQQHGCHSEDELDWNNLLLKELLPLIMDWQNTDIKRMASISENLKAFQRRLQDQNEASWSNSDVERIKESISNLWTSCEFDIIELETGILCWAVKICK